MVALILSVLAGWLVAMVVIVCLCAAAKRGDHQDYAQRRDPARARDWHR